MTITPDPGMDTMNLKENTVLDDESLKSLDIKCVSGVVEEPKVQWI